MADIPCDGTRAAIQAAVNSAVEGDTVRVSDGEFTWATGDVVTVPKNNLFITGPSPAGCNGHPNFSPYTPSTFLTKNANRTQLFYVTGARVRISGLQMKGNITSAADDTRDGAAVLGWHAVDLRVDHCTLIDFPGNAVNLYNPQDGIDRGLVDHCVIDNPYKDVYPGTEWAYGLYAQGVAYSWDADITKFLGKYEAIPTNFPVIYGEDNHFTRCRHVFDAIQGGWYCARYNLMDKERPEGWGSIDIHGPLRASYTAGRGVEVYENRIVGTRGGDGAGMWIRGGGGAIYHNTIVDMDNPNEPNGGIILSDEDDLTFLPEQLVHDLWIWGNTYINVVLPFYSYKTAKPNVDFFYSDDDSAKPAGYNPYPYPHPLIGGEVYREVSVDAMSQLDLSGIKAGFVLDRIS